MAVTFSACDEFPKLNEIQTTKEPEWEYQFLLLFNGHGDILLYPPVDLPVQLRAHGWDQLLELGGGVRAALEVHGL